MPAPSTTPSRGPPGADRARVVIHLLGEPSVTVDGRRRPTSQATPATRPGTSTCSTRTTPAGHRHNYGRAYERLRRVKAVYDPDNLFHLNPNLTPAR